MKTPVHNLDCNQGATFKLRLRLKADGNPRPITGYSARMQVRANVAASSPIIDLSTEEGSITIDGPAGIVLVRMTPEATAALAVPHAKSDFPLSTKCVYDLLLIAPDPGDTELLMRGAFTITAGVTR